MFTTMTFERRMCSYITLALLALAFLLVFTTVMKANQPVYIDITPVHMEEIRSEVLDVSEIEKVGTAPLAELDTIEIDSDEYDGDIIVATAREVITMQIVDGVKTFTNHLIG